MGNARSLLKASVPDKADREVFVEYTGFQRIHRNEFSVFTLSIGYRRHRWTIEKRFREINKLDRLLESKYEQDMEVVLRPHSHFRNIFRGQDDNFLINRGREFAAYIQLIADNRALFMSTEVQEFLEIGPGGLSPALGRKGKEGYVRVCSGGYTVKHSSKPEFLRSWKWRWVALNDTQISVYQNRDGQLLASVQIDQGLSISAAGKIVVIQTNTRKLSFMARNSRFANEWVVSAQAFYGTVPRAMACASGSAYPIREHIDCRIYTNSRDYYMNLTVSILRATETIFIAAFALNPGVVLTRPPLPPVRLDQLLKTKADQGVLILINLNKDASGVVGYPQYKSESVKRYLMSLSTNIEVIRHPSAGKNTWSHHDNVIVVDRNVAYISGLELCYGCYDDSNNSVDDETGCRFPGPDYVQPHPSLHCPVRTPQSAVVGQSGAYNALEVYSGIDSSSSGQFQPRTRHHESFTSPSALIDNDDDEATVVEPESIQEREARLAAETDEYSFDVAALGAYPSFSSARHNPDQVDRATYVPPPTSAIPVTTETSASAGAKEEEGLFASLIKNVEKHLNQALADIEELVTGEGKGAKGETCLMYPRQPVHSVHAAVSGQAARDVGSHFVQRWNHSRLMKWEIERTHISDITDNTNFGVCPRCGATGLDENVTICPPCGMNLGSKASFLNPNDVMHPNPSFAPALPGTFTCITFQCHFMGQLGFSLAGDGPVLVNRLLKVSRGHGVVSEGTLLSSQGPNMELLLAHSALKVTPGDVVISVDGITVTHLNTEELTRFIRHRKEFLSHQYGTDLTPMTVLFRRHYIEELHNLPSVVETDTTLYPVAEFEIMHSPEVTVALMRNSEAPPNKSDSYDINYADAPYAAAANLGYQHTSYVGTTTPVMVNEPVAPQANGTDPYGVAMALMDALVTPMPVAPQNVEPHIRPVVLSPQMSPPRYVVSEPAAADRVAYEYSEGIAASSSDTDFAVVAGPVVQSVSLVAEAKLELPPTSAPYVDSFAFPEVPTAPVNVASAQPTSNDYLSSYDLMPLVPTRPINASNATATGRRDVERKAMALSGKGHPIRTRPFDPSAGTGADLPTSGFSIAAAQVSDSTIQQVAIDEGATIVYGTPNRTAMLSADDTDHGSISPPTHALHANFAPTNGATTRAAANQTTALRVDPPSYGMAVSQPNSNIDKSSAYPTFPSAAPVGYAAPVAISINAQPYSALSYPSNHGNNFDEAKSGGAENFVQDIHNNLQYMLAPAPAPVPVAIGASDADVQRINRENYDNSRYKADPARLEKGKARALQLETQLSMSNLFHGKAFNASIVSFESRVGHCHAQVLRSVNPWSHGGHTECSIYNAWINAIKEAHKFIYIETSTFTGGPMSGCDVKNEVIKALLDKIVEKANARQLFRVVIILPLLGVGNFIENEASRVMLQRQYMALCRGPNSLLYQFVQRVPGVDPSNYISFLSLRNWGVMNNQVVSEQIALKSNLLLVDDRVLILGSGGISDRAMLGDRNSEIALRIEDMTHIDVKFGGATWTVGFLPHKVRTELMRHHLGLPEVDLSDPISEYTYMTLLRGCAALNSGVYDELDSDLSVYRCRSMQQFSSALSKKQNKSFHDLRVREITKSIKGFLVFFPLDFLNDSLLCVNTPVSASGVSAQSLWV